MVLELAAGKNRFHALQEALYHPVPRKPKEVSLYNSATRERCLATARQELTEEEFDKLRRLLSASREVDAEIQAGQF